MVAAPQGRQHCMGDRKYRQRGYQDDDRAKRPEGAGRPAGQPRERIGPRTPQFPGRVTVARCANCGTLLPKGFDPQERCLHCGFELHCCKQCVHFDTSARWECTQPISARFAVKDARNDCGFYEVRMSNERETTSGSSRPDDPRKAFENLFKK